MRKHLIFALIMMVTVFTFLSCKKDGGVMPQKDQVKFWENVERAHGIDLPDFWVTQMKHTWKSPNGATISSNLDWTEEKKAQYGLEVDEAFAYLKSVASPEYQDRINPAQANILLKDPQGSSTEVGQCPTFTRTDGQEVAGQVVGVNFIADPIIVVADPLNAPATDVCRQERINAVKHEFEHVFFFYHDKGRFNFFQGAQDWHSFFDRIKADPELGRRTEPSGFKAQPVKMDRTHIRR